MVGIVTAASWVVHPLSLGLGVGFHIISFEVPKFVKRGKYWILLSHKIRGKLNIVKIVNVLPKFHSHELTVSQQKHLESGFHSLETT